MVIVDTHEGNLGAAALVELVAASLTTETLEQQLSAEVTEGQREEGLPHLSIKNTFGSGNISNEVKIQHFLWSNLTVLTKLCVVSGTFSNTSTCNSSPVSQEMSVSQPIGFFSLKQEVNIPLIYTGLRHNPYHFSTCGEFSCLDIDLDV